MQIKFEHISAKNLVNFYPSRPLIKENLLQVAKDKENLHCPFLQNIMQIAGVERCLITSELLSIVYSADADFEDVRLSVMAEIDDFATQEGVLESAEIADLQTACEALADAFIRPTLNRDNGDIEILQVNEQSLELKFTGHCAGCPYAQNTLQNVIIRTFRKYFPELDIVLKE